MKNKINFYIIRHGKTVLNTIGKMQGCCDSPLTQQGISVAQNLGKGLREIEFQDIYTSDLNRTKETAENILKFQGQTNLIPIAIKDFNECNFGVFESRKTKEVWREISLYLGYKTIDHFFKDLFNPKQSKLTFEKVLDTIKSLDTIGIAEDFSQVEIRNKKALEKIAKSYRNIDREINIAIVSHCISITVMLYNFGAKKQLTDFIENASVSRLLFINDEFKLQSFGDVSYLEKGLQL